MCVVCRVVCGRSEEFCSEELPSGEKQVVLGPLNSIDPPCFGKGALISIDFAVFWKAKCDNGMNEKFAKNVVLPAVISIYMNTEQRHCLVI